MTAPKPDAPAPLAVEREHVRVALNELPTHLQPDVLLLEPQNQSTERFRILGSVIAELRERLAVVERAREESIERSRGLLGEKERLEARLQRTRDQLRLMETRHGSGQALSAAKAAAITGRAREANAQGAVGADGQRVQEAAQEPPPTEEESASAVLWIVAHSHHGSASVRRLARKFLKGNTPEFVAATRHKLARLDREVAQLRTALAASREREAKLRTALERAIPFIAAIAQTESLDAQEAAELWGDLRALADTAAPETP